MTVNGNTGYACGVLVVNHARTRQNETREENDFGCTDCEGQTDRTGSHSRTEVYFDDTLILSALNFWGCLLGLVVV